MTHKQRLFIDGKWTTAGTGENKEVRSPFTGEVVSHTALADETQVNLSIESVHSAFLKFRKSSRYLRSKLLAVMAKKIDERREDFVTMMAREAGKPVSLGNVEVSRAIQTFTIASEEVKRFGGEVIPIDNDAGAQAFLPAVSYWVPKGPVLAISPFNFPLNLIAHKVAPAFAVGASVWLKPPPQAPGCAVLLTEIFEEVVKSDAELTASLPLSSLQLIHASNELIGRAVGNPNLEILSFTGSANVGWALKSKANRQKVILELGGNAGVYVHSDADLSRAASRSAVGGFSYAGQVCISVQRIFVHKEVYSLFEENFLSETKKVKYGDPFEKEVSVGPVIDELAANRIQQWIDEAVKSGAKLLAGGKRNGNVFEPTILTNVTNTSKLSCQEVFGPVVILEKVESESEGFKKINDSEFGLQAGVFTKNTDVMNLAIRDLEVGGVMINEVPTFRADNMPYGGIKGSGLGREGVRYTMEEYCERKTVVQFNG